MYLDVRELREFYHETEVGQAVQQALSTQVDRLWPDLSRQTLVGYGFATPLLRHRMAEAARTTALMPGLQGVMHWPSQRPNAAVLCEETHWPVETGSVDRLILLHGLDPSDHPFAVLEECYRVMAGEARAIFIVPNRASLWARRDGTPFSFSRPYTMGQLEKQLANHGLQPVAHCTALYQPPWRNRFWRRAGPMLEKIGQAIPAWNGGGALIVEAKKQVPRPRRPGLGQIISRPLGVLEGVPQPEVARSLLNKTINPK